MINMKFLFSLFFLFTACASGPRKVDTFEGRPRSQYEAYGKKLMISTQGNYTTAAAKEIYDKGGNIYDAAVAATFSISVERPHSTGLGGGGFLLMYDAKTDKTLAFDFREMAPQKSYSRMYLDKQGKQITDRSITGALAVGTPGLVAGILGVHRRFGKLPLKVVMDPAIRLARDGFQVYSALHEAINEERLRLVKFPDSKKIFLKENGKALETGDLLVQKDLAKTLERIVQKGEKGFYQGVTAQKIVKSMQKHHGLITHDDLNSYQVKERRPIIGNFKGNEIISMPPPSSGGAHIIQILNILEHFPIKEWGAQSAKSVHVTSTAMQIAFAERAEHMGDSDFVRVPIKQITSKKNAKLWAKLIPKDKAIASSKFPIPFEKLPKESDHTTHFSLMDGEGNIVVSTQTINGWFGSALVAEGTGIVMNNEMDDFASNIGGVNMFGAVGGKNNLVAPKKRPLSSMSPTIVKQKNGAVLALGTEAGTRILTCVMQTILNVLEYDMNLWDSVAATRYHHQWYPEVIQVGQPYFTSDVEQTLKSMGHKIVHEDLGCRIQAISRAADGTLHGVSDPREEGMSLGI